MTVILKNSFIVLVVILIALSFWIESHAASCDEEQFKNSVVLISLYKEGHQDNKSQNGVIVTKDGHILTEYSLIKNEKEPYEIRVATPGRINSMQYKAYKIEQQPIYSFLLLQITPNDVEDLKLEVPSVNLQQRTWENNTELCALGYRRKKNIDGEESSMHRITVYNGKYENSAQDLGFTNSFVSATKLDDDDLLGSPVFDKDGQLIGIISHYSFPGIFVSTHYIKPWLNLKNDYTLDDLVPISGFVFDINTGEYLEGVRIKVPEYPEHNKPTDVAGQFIIYIPNNKFLKLSGAIEIFFELEGYKTSSFLYRIGEPLEMGIEKLKGDRIK